MGVPGSGGNFICVGRSRMDATATSAAVDETFATTSAAASLAATWSRRGHHSSLWRSCLDGHGRGHLCGSTRGVGLEAPPRTG